MQIAPAPVAIAPSRLSNRTVSEFGERALIARITARLATASWVVLGPGDDAAVVVPDRGAHEVLTVDAQVEGIHFDRRFVPPDAIGHRALAVNLSDLAAMGATPRTALLSLVLPAALQVAVVDGMLDGILALAAAHRVALVGGNVSRSPGPLILDVAAIGSVRPRRAITRAGARPGDDVYVTGTIGEAVVGLRRLQQAMRPDARPLEHERPPALVHSGPEDTMTAAAAPPADACEKRYLRPEPRVRAGLLLGRNRAATACVDLSDGLADGVRQMAEASAVGIALDASAIPLTDAVRQWHEQQGNDPVMAALRGGDDYELLFTVRPAHRGRLRAVQHSLGRQLPLTKIGVVTKERRLVVRTDRGEQNLPEGFEHFRPGATT